MATIAIVGAGSVGRALAQGFTGAGHEVVFGVRTPAGSRQQGLRAEQPEAAAAAADIVILAVPATAVVDLVPSLALRPGHVLVDATNAVGAPVPHGHETMGHLVASLAPAGVAVVKAFNTIGAEHLADGHLGEARAFLPVAGDDAGVEVVLPLAHSLGFDAVALGGREAFGLVEAHARLWIHLAFARGWGRSFGFAVVRD
jgi:predicted dinucleotide-binding enzyme